MIKNLAIATLTIIVGVQVMGWGINSLMEDVDNSFNRYETIETKMVNHQR